MITTIEPPIIKKPKSLKEIIEEEIEPKKKTKPKRVSIFKKTSFLLLKQ